VLGAVTPEMSLSSVLLPAPLRPTSPTISPLPISHDTSRSAQNRLASPDVRARPTQSATCSASVVDCRPAT
jgi:hypothetical protein